jgi:GT2 family glycosyltransferase
MTPKVTVGVVLYGTKFLEQSLPSLVKQDYDNIEYLLKDNSPNAEAEKFVKENLPEVDKKVELFSGENNFHSGGHNDLIKKSTGQYYIAASNDILYSKDFISKAICELEKKENQKYGSAAIKLLFWDYLHGKKTNRIDSCGLGIKASHNFFDIGQGEEDRGQYDKQKEIFGSPGALAIYRREALEEVRYKSEYFDELLHFKNDVDLAYRLQWVGHHCLFLPQIVCWHQRGLDSLRKRRSRSEFELKNSFIGHNLVIIKNWSSDFSLKVKLATKIRNLTRLTFTALFEKKTFRQSKKISKLKKEILKKRLVMPRKVKAREIEKLMQ